MLGTRTPCNARRCLCHASALFCLALPRIAAFAGRSRHRHCRSPARLSTCIQITIRIIILILTIILNTSTVLRFHHPSSTICRPSALLLFPCPSATALLLIGFFPSSQPLKVHCPSATPCLP
ncbi:hypothetical protein EDB80DRAFT_716041 [Ilyonectria destructans]|nr:hypothetical protein EDB80DRAFT_716041 [Ilyonectria destructans]